MCSTMRYNVVQWLVWCSTVQYSVQCTRPGLYIRAYTALIPIYTVKFRRFDGFKFRRLRQKFRRAPKNPTPDYVSFSSTRIYVISIFNVLPRDSMQ